MKTKKNGKHWESVVGRGTRQKILVMDSESEFVCYNLIQDLLYGGETSHETISFLK